MNKQEAYIKDRVLSQLAWFSQKAQLNKRRYYASTVAIIILTTSIPVLSGIDFEIKDILIAIIGAVAGILSSISIVYDYKNNWVRYRFASESIKYEYNQFLIIEPTDADFKAFVDRIETRILETSSDWKQSIKNIKNG